MFGCPFKALTKGPPLAELAAGDEEECVGGNVEEGLCVLFRPLLLLL